MIATLYILLAAAEGGGGVPEWIPRAFNLALVLGFLAFVLRKPMATFFETRRAAILADLEQAKRDKEAAESRLAEVETRLSRLAAEQAEIRAEADREAEAEHARVEARAEEEARKIAEMAEREIGGALKAARADLQRFAAEKSVEMAEGLIRAEMTDEDRQRMVEQYADQLGGVTK
jgi:F-type H+-transporting ATPase subunit b